MTRRCPKTSSPCDRPAVCGDGLCARDREPFRELTTRERIEAGAKFDPFDNGRCTTCLEAGTVDRWLALCRSCWRAWRFGAA